MVHSPITYRVRGAYGQEAGLTDRMGEASSPIFYEQGKTKAKNTVHLAN